MPNRDPLLSPEQFRKAKDNTCLYFVPEVPGDMIVAVSLYRQRSAYIKCTQEIPIAFGRVARALSRMLARYETNSERYSRMLYRAYRMMYPYAEHNSDIIN